ncbi:MAG: prepilin-type N-terminal cleavage/methylation domain-containing protein [Alphaproteobacteria bacterium]|nr:prepilin-type N-terminal cleavage/methylation domain-containing protein [Alphaproteobacteria bacterium]
MIKPHIRNLGGRHRRGFTLTEAAIVLGVAGMVLGAIWVAASQVYKNHRVGKVVQQITTLSQNIKSYYATSRPFASTGMSLSLELFNAGLIPSDMTPHGGNAASGFDIGLGSSVLTIMSGPMHRQNFYIFINGMPTEDCAAIGPRTVGSNAIPGLATDTIGHEIYSFPGTHLGYRLATDTRPFSGCTQIFWVFSLR